MNGIARVADLRPERLEDRLPARRARDADHRHHRAILDRRLDVGDGGAGVLEVVEERERDLSAADAAAGVDALGELRGEVPDRGDKAGL